MIYTYSGELTEDNRQQITESVDSFVNLHQYLSVNSLGKKGLSLREVINRGNEIILSNAPTLLKITFKDDKFEIILDVTVKATARIFINKDELALFAGKIIDSNRMSLIAFELGSNGVLLP